VLCPRCHTDSEADSANCRACGTALAVGPELRTAAENKRRAAEIADLRAQIAARKAADDQARAVADAARMSEAELADLRAQAAGAGIAIDPRARDANGNPIAIARDAQGNPVTGAVTPARDAQGNLVNVASGDRDAQGNLIDVTSGYGARSAYNGTNRRTGRATRRTATQPQPIAFPDRRVGATDRRRVS
jgi:hypothetical protein